MADFRSRVLARRSRPPVAVHPRLIDEEITPSSGWIQLPEFHCLLIDLPGFKKDEIKLNVEESGSIVVSGRRRTGEGKQVHFEMIFHVPEDGDNKGIRTIFEQDTLRVNIPKVATTQVEEEPKSNESKRKDPASTTNDTNDKDKDKEKIAGSPASASRSSDSEEKEPQRHEYYESPVEKKEDDDDDEYESSDFKRDEPASTHDTNDKDKEKTAGSTASASRSSDSEEKKMENEYESSQPNCKEAAKEETAVNPSSSPVILKIIENKGILIASLVSFTLGVFLSQKFHPLPPK